MNGDDRLVKPGVVKHGGRNYGGEKQKDSRIAARYTKREPSAPKLIPPPSLTGVRSVKKHTSEELLMKKTISLGFIQEIVWNPDSALPSFRVNCEQLKSIAEHLFSRRPSLNDAYYANLIKRLEEKKFPAVAVFQVVKQGEHPGKGIVEPAPFFLAKIEGHEFYLPLSFLAHCRGATAQNPQH
jgi:hypothetical protein